MSFHKKSIGDADLKGKRILIRSDFNVPLENGKISDDYRIEKALPTIKYALDQGACVILCSHLGRPNGKDNKLLSLRPVADRLGEFLKKEVKFLSTATGEETVSACKNLKPGQVILLENLRFYPEEESNDDDFARQLAKLADIFVQDGFGVVHRSHASTDAITRHLPSVAGLLVKQEYEMLTKATNNPDRPLMAIIGGAKISDKIDVLKRLIDVADAVAIGGAMANTFLLASGVSIGDSLADEDEVDLAKQIIQEARNKSRNGHFIFYLPQDGVVAAKIDKAASTRIVDWSAHVIADIENYPKRPPREASYVMRHEKILDIGPFSGAFISGLMQMADTVIWNGAMGVTETDGVQGPIGPFAHGTELIMEAMLGSHGHKPFTVVGGGDTVGFIEERGLAGQFNHVSTGGGASLELMSGRKLPGIEALEDK